MYADLIDMELLGIPLYFIINHSLWYKKYKKVKKGQKGDGTGVGRALGNYYYTG